MKKTLILVSISLALSSCAYAESIPSTTGLNTSQTIIVPEKDLALGQRGSDVKHLQDLLVSRGYLSTDSSTGYFGAKTRAALMKLQKENGIPNIGKFGPTTRAFLKNKAAETKPIGGDIDSHGCLLAAGYTWDSTAHTCNKPWEKLSSLLSRDWVLQSIDGQNYSNLSFKVVDGSVSARACNNIFGKIKIDDTSNTIIAPMLASTMMACDNNLMYQDTALNQILGTTAKVTFDLNSSPILMTMVGGNHTLVFILK